jgi:hypothetical protein
MCGDRGYLVDSSNGKLLATGQEAGSGYFYVHFVFVDVLY